MPQRHPRIWAVGRERSRRRPDHIRIPCWSVLFGSVGRGASVVPPCLEKPRHIGHCRTSLAYLDSICRDINVDRQGMIALPHVGLAGIEMMREHIQEAIRESAHLPKRQRWTLIQGANRFPTYGQPWRLWKATLREELISAGLLAVGVRCCRSSMAETPWALSSTDVRCAAHGCTRLAGGLDRVFCSSTCRGRGKG